VRIYVPVIHLIKLMFVYTSCFRWNSLSLNQSSASSSSEAGAIHAVSLMNDQSQW